MFRGEFGICDHCGEDNVLIVNKSRWACEICNNKIKKDAKRQSGKRSAQAGDWEFYRSIWQSRPHRSEVSGKPLGDKMQAQFFSHVLAKGAYPSFRHYEKNIQLLTFDEHFQWEFGDKSHPKWIKSLILEEELKKEYYDKFRESRNRNFRDN